jgi:NADH:ubiquinone oxidoreductase subunit 2 (subunit N)
MYKPHTFLGFILIISAVSIYRYIRLVLMKWFGKDETGPATRNDGKPLKEVLKCNDDADECKYCEQEY